MYLAGWIRQSGVYPAILPAYPAQRIGPYQTLRNLGKFGQAGHDSDYSSGTRYTDSGKRTQDPGKLQPKVLPLLPEGKHGKHSASAQAWPSKGRLFYCYNPILIPDFTRAGEAMPEPQKSPSKTGLEELKKQLKNDFLKVTTDFLANFSAFRYCK